jgi:TolB-like protein/DNA-binding winged helix-turn-helix (wHTH) protein/Tfp pilus assembly protein PilF
MIRQDRVYRFGNFTLNPVDRSLRQEGREIHLRPKVYETLLYFVERHGHLVKKEELLSSIWSDVIVTDNTLNKCIEELRHVLQDNPHQPHLIQTVPRVGFKFIADVMIEPDASESRAINNDRVSPDIFPEREKTWTGKPAEAGSSSELQSVKPVFSSRLIKRVIVGGSILLLCLLIWYGITDLTGDPGYFNSIAVLPFSNLSGDSDQDYFSDGMTDALISDLAMIRSLRVISRTSVMSYKKVLKPLPEIARELNVDLIVEGSVQRAGDRVRITAQLIHAKTDQHLWVKTYERDIHDILILQRELAHAIASEIRSELTLPYDREMTEQVDPEAYEYYLKGRYYWNKRTPEDFRKGIVYFEQAVAHDSNFALAYVGLADSYNMLSNYNVIPPNEVIPHVNEALVRAFGIDGGLAEAYASHAFTNMFYDWDWPEAKKALIRAIEINPNYAEAHHWYGLFLAMQGQFDDALIEMKHAQNLDPLSIIINTNIGWVLYFAGRYDEAVDQIQHSLEFDPAFVSGHIKLGWTYEQLGRHDDAIEEFRTGIRLVGNDPALQAILGRAYALADLNDEALHILEQLQERGQEEYVTPYMIAVIYTVFGDFEQAFDWLHTAYDDRDGWLAWLNVDPKLDPLRIDPRFAELAGKIGFK